VPELGSQEIKLIVLTIEQLAEMGISSGSTDNFTFEGKEFRSGPTFSLKMRAAALGFCERQERHGTECLLVERASAVTVWTAVAKPINRVEQQPKPEFDRAAFIERCRQELTKSIGPMASLIIDELVNKSDPLSPRRSVEWIASQLPNAQLAEEFKQNMQK
jgi:hypothetical protein